MVQNPPWQSMFTKKKAMYGDFCAILYIRIAIRTKKLQSTVFIDAGCTVCGALICQVARLTQSRDELHLVLFNKTNKKHEFSKFYFVKKL